MTYIDLTFPTPEENLFFDEYLLEQAEENFRDEILRIWEPKEYFVVLGYSNKLESEVNLDGCQKQKIPILRRISGGGTVLQGPGCFNYSLILNIKKNPALKNIRSTNHYIMSQHKELFENLLGKPVSIQGLTDLTITNRKFSGNSQRRKKSHLLFHGTFLLDFDISIIDHCLTIPSRQPDYRQNRSNQDFLMNVYISPTLIKESLGNLWSTTQKLNNIPLPDIAKLAQVKYSSPKWFY
jgi:lipoate-protein ligase A